MQCRACVLGFAVAVSIACGVGTRQRVTLDPVAPAASKEWHAPSEQEAEAWGRRVETLARTGDIVRLAEAVDFGAILESASGGVDGVDDLREHFIRGVREKLSLGVVCSKRSTRRWRAAEATAFFGCRRWTASGWPCSGC